MMGFGISTLILGNISNLLFRLPRFGWRATYVLIALLLASALFLCSRILKQPDIPFESPEVKVNDRSLQEKSGISPREMIKTGSFWKVFFCMTFLAAVGSFVISIAKDLALASGANDNFSAVLVGVLSVCNGLGRIFSGALFDYAGRRRTFLFTNIVTIFAAIVILLAVGQQLLWLCIVGLILTGISYGSCPTIAAAFTSDFYGWKYYSTNFSIMSFTLMTASFISAGMNILLTHTENYQTVFLFLLILSIIALFFNLSVKK